MGAALTVMLGSIVLLVVSLVMIGRPVIDEFTNAPTMAYPGSATLHLGPGSYLIYARIESYSESVGPVGTRPITPAGTSVTGPGGPVVLSAPTASATTTRNSALYAADVAFTLTSSGTYKVRITSPGPGQALISLSYSGLLHSVAGWLVVALLAALAGIVATAFFIVTLVRRRRARRLVLPISNYGYDTPPG